MSLNLSTYRIENSDEWDKCVRSFREHDVYYLSGYVKAFQIHGDGDPLLFCYEGDDIRGINVVMCRDVALDPHFVGLLPEKTYFDFATPYGYGGWLLEGEGTPEPLFAEYEEWCRKYGVISEFVRFHPVLDNQKYSADAYDVIRLGNTVTMDLKSPETIWANLHSKNRNMIRKAQKNGIIIYNGRSQELLEMFKEIYNKTMDKDHAEPYYYFKHEFYDSILKDLPYNAQVFYAQMLDGKIIAASIMLAANGRLNYHLSSSLKDYQNLAPTNLLLYEAARWGAANGCKTLHLGGGVGSGEDGLYQFKKTFNRNSNCWFHIGRKILNAETYQKLTSLRREKDNSFGKTNFFPEYRG